ncbi:MAG: tetratricopeptide repeat protein [Planctomycetota bacterium]
MKHRLWLLLIIIVITSGCGMIAETALAPLAMAQMYYQRGMQMLNTGKDYQSAADSFQKALELNPQYKEAQSGLLMAYGKLDQTKKATEFMDHIGSMFRDDSKVVDSPTLLGGMDNEFILSMIAGYEQDIRDNPDSPLPYFLIGNHYYQAGQYRKALPYIYKVLNLSSPRSQLYRSAEGLLVMMGVQQ